jgi:hypothetical protein
VIPLCVGLGLLTNGVFVSKRLIETAKREMQGEESRRRLEGARDTSDDLAPPADWYDSGAAKPSVTEHTTRQLEKSRRSE